MTIYALSSADASAPVLDGTPGSLIALLDAVLVNGYGSHPGLGWTIAFTDTNKRAYRMPAGTSQAYLRVVDDGTLSSGQVANVNAYTAMSDIDTGTGPLSTSGGYVIKSRTADATARSWRFASDGEFIHFFPRWDTAFQADYSLQFGDIRKLHDSPAGPITLFASVDSSGVPTNVGQFSCAIDSTPPHSRSGITPDADGTAISVQYEPGRTPFAPSSADRVFGTFYFDSPMQNGLEYVLWPVYIAGYFSGSASSKWLAGTVPGVYAPWNLVTSITDGTLIVDPPGYAGRTFMAVRISQQAGPENTVAFVDITGPWR